MARSALAARGERAGGRLAAAGDRLTGEMARAVTELALGNRYVLLDVPYGAEALANQLRREYGVSLLTVPSRAQLEEADVLILFAPRTDLRRKNPVVLPLYDETAALPPLLLPPALEDQMPAGCSRPQLLAAMNDHAEELDAVITAHLKGWTLNRVPRVALVALRLALAEMLYGEEQKPGVAINEAVELVKKYGAESDHQFVNGLLGTVAREREESAEAQC